VHSKIKRALCALLSLLLLSALAGCTPPPDVMAGFDENGEKTPHVDTSPPAADRHKDPNAPQKVDWQRERMLMYQGEYYFFRNESIDPATIDSRLTMLGLVSSTVSQTDVPNADLQTNCGYIGCTAYRIEAQPQYIYLMDSGALHIFESPAPIQPAYEMPSYLNYAGSMHIINHTIRQDSIYQADDYIFVGTITAEVPADQAPQDSLTTNCGYVGGSVYIKPHKVNNGYILLADGYVRFDLSYMPKQTVCYQGTRYALIGAASRNLPNGYQKVGAIVVIVPDTALPSVDFFCNFDGIGCEIYAHPGKTSYIYILYDSVYHPYKRLEQ
jgi:hypothetical protein